MVRQHRGFAAGMLIGLGIALNAWSAEPVQELFHPEAPITEAGYLPGVLEEGDQEVLLPYVVKDGMMVHQGDMLLGPVDAVQQPDTGIEIHGAALKSLASRWPDGVVFYSFGSPLVSSYKQAILDAMTYLQGITSIRFVERTSERDYVQFFSGGGCYSYVGRVGGMQPISIGSGCGAKGVISHEILHSLGIFHEQSRWNRDDYVEILWENIADDRDDQFARINSDIGEDLHAYDYSSVMHYHSTAFTKNGLPTIVSKVPGVVLGQRSGLSEIDIATVQTMYAVDMSLNGSAPATIAPNSRLDLQLKVNNLGVSKLGYVSARELSLQIGLPSGVSYVSASSADGWLCSDSADKLICSLASLKGADESVLNLQFQTAASVGESLIFDAELSAQNRDVDEGNNTLSLIAGKGASTYDLAVVGNVSASNLTVGESTNLTLDVSNRLNTAAQTLLLQVTVPASLSFQSSANPAWRCVNGASMLSCRLDTLAAKSTSQLKLVYKALKAASSARLAYELSASGSYLGSGENQGARDVVIRDVPASDDLAVTSLASPTSLSLGASTTLAVTVTNQLSSTANSLTYTLSFPAMLQSTSVSAPGWRCVASSRQLSCTLSSLSGKSSKALSFGFKAINTGTGSLSSKVRSSLSDATSGNNSHSVKLTVTGTQPAPEGGTDGHAGSSSSGGGGGGGSLAYLPLFVLLLGCLGRCLGGGSGRH